MAEEEEQQDPSSLTKKELWDISLMVFAFFCVICSVTMIIGTGNLIILSVGGSTALAPFANSFVYLGMSFISLFTGKIFDTWGRKIGFWAGCVFGAIASIIGCIALRQSSPVLVLVGQFIFGFSFEIGFCLRYSSVELVPANYSSKAVAWVLAGGCFASVVGPETTIFTDGMFGDGNTRYMGTYIGCAFFNILEMVGLYLIGFPAHKPLVEPEDEEGECGEIVPQTKRVSDVSADDIEDAEQGPTPTTTTTTTTSKKEEMQSSPNNKNELLAVLKSPRFYIPLMMGIFTWAIMALPMSLFRVTMGELGFTSRQSLTIIEIHFLCMYGPGFWSGKVIQRYGALRVCQLAVVCFVLSCIVSLFIPNNNESTALWYVSLIFLGFAWHFGFSGATVWVTQSYSHAMHLKPQVQAANDGFMFLVTGAVGLANGYIYDDWGGAGIDGWKLVNYFALGLCGASFVLLHYGSINKEMKAAQDAAAGSIKPGRAESETNESQEEEEEEEEAVVVDA
eukprot:Nitzschia sp. Nitz4//scaffold160_size51814//35369//36889//NITZ4_006915-RA/size51814-processed-gene-0.62-mRNA-1//-1//CDS//3329537860//3677//frame0